MLMRIRIPHALPCPDPRCPIPAGQVIIQVSMTGSPHMRTLNIDPDPRYGISGLCAPLTKTATAKGMHIIGGHAYANLN